MRAVVCSAPKDIAITEVVEKPVGPGQVRLRVGF